MGLRIDTETASRDNKITEKSNPFSSLFFAGNSFLPPEAFPSSSSLLSFHSLAAPLTPPDADTNALHALMEVKIRARSRTMAVAPSSRSRMAEARSSLWSPSPIQRHHDWRFLIWGWGFSDSGVRIWLGYLEMVDLCFWFGVRKLILYTFSYVWLYIGQKNKNLF